MEVGRDEAVVQGVHFAAVGGVGIMRVGVKSCRAGRRWHWGQDRRRQDERAMATTAYLRMGHGMDDGRRSRSGPPWLIRVEGGCHTHRYQAGPYKAPIWCYNVFSCTCFVLAVCSFVLYCIHNNFFVCVCVLCFIKAVAINQSINSGGGVPHSHWLNNVCVCVRLNHQQVSTSLQRGPYRHRHIRRYAEGGDSHHTDDDSGHECDDDTPHESDASRF